MTVNGLMSSNEKLTLFMTLRVRRTGHKMWWDLGYTGEIAAAIAGESSVTIPTSFRLLVDRWKNDRN